MVRQNILHFHRSRPNARDLVPPVNNIAFLGQEDVFALQQEDLRLPFLANAAHLYDDYIHFLLEHGRVDDALRAADYSRAQTLAEGLGILSFVLGILLWTKIV